MLRIGPSRNSFTRVDYELDGDSPSSTDMSGSPRPGARPPARAADRSASAGHCDRARSSTAPPQPGLTAHHVELQPAGARRAASCPGGRQSCPQDLTQSRTRVSLLRKRAQAAQPVPAGLMRRGFGRTEPSAGEKAQTARNEPSICARASARRMSHRKAASRPHSATPRRTPRARQVHATCAAQK